MAVSLFKVLLRGAIPDEETRLNYLMLNIEGETEIVKQIAHLVFEGDDSQEVQRKLDLIRGLQIEAKELKKWLDLYPTKTGGVINWDTRPDFLKEWEDEEHKIVLKIPIQARWENDNAFKLEAREAYALALTEPTIDNDDWCFHDIYNFAGRVEFLFVVAVDGSGKLTKAYEALVEVLRKIERDGYFDEEKLSQIQDEIKTSSVRDAMKRWCREHRPTFTEDRLGDFMSWASENDREYEREDYYPKDTSFAAWAREYRKNRRALSAQKDKHGQST